MIDPLAHWQAIRVQGLSSALGLYFMTQDQHLTTFDLYQRQDKTDQILSTIRNFETNSDFRHHGLHMKIEQSGGPSS